MAKKDKKAGSIIENPDFFMKVGMAMGQQVEPDYDAIGTAIEKGFGAVDKQLKLNKLNEEIELNKGNKAREDLMAKFPDGVAIEKAGKEWGGIPTEFLTKQRAEYDRYAAIIAQGKDTPGYEEAVRKSNSILGDIEDMSNQFELIAQHRQSAFNMEDEDGNSLLSGASTAWDQMNINNIATMNMEALQPRIEYIDGRSVLILKDAQGNDINAEDFGQKLGRQKSNKLRDQIDASAKEVRAMGLTFGQTGKGAWDPQASLKDIEVMARDKNAVVDLMFEEDLIDQYIRERYGSVLLEDTEDYTPGVDLAVDAKLNESIYMLRDQFKDPKYKEDIAAWFVQNEYNTLLGQFDSSTKAGPTGGVTGTFDINNFPVIE